MRRISWKGVLHQVTKFDDPEFLASLSETRKIGLLIGYLFLACINPLYILIDRSMFPGAWQQWNFLGVRLAAAFLGGLALALRPLRESMLFFMVPFSILHCGITLMLITYPLDRWTEAYQGSALMVVGMSLISAFSLTQQLVALIGLYLFCYTIWIWNPPPSMEVWMTDGGFSNLNTSFIIAGAFYYLRLSYAYTIHQLHKQLSLKNELLETQSRDVQSILRNIPEVVCIITLDSTQSRLVLDPHSSDFLKHSSHKAEASHTDFFDFILDRTDLSADVQGTIRWILIAALQEDSVQWEMNQHLLPREFRYQRDEAWLILEVDWNVIADDAGRVQKVLLTIRNVTDMRHWQESVKARQSEAQKIFELLLSETQALHHFFQAAQQLLKSADGRSDAAFRNLHSLKGLARTYQLNELLLLVHQQEERMIESRAEAKSDRDLEQGLRACRESLDAYQKCFQRLQGTAHHASQRPSLAGLAAPVLQLNEALAKGDIHESRRLLPSINRPFAQSLTELMRDEREGLPRLARELGKAEPQLDIINGTGLIPLTAQMPLKTALGHLLRNSMDHGLESPEQRQRQGKAGAGRIRIEMQKAETESLVILYQDDGQGLDLEAIRKKLPHERFDLSPEQLADMIFLPGLSTAARASEISGRGMGMDCVRDELMKLGGKAELLLGRTLPGGRRPFTVRMEFPRGELT